MNRNNILAACKLLDELLCGPLNPGSTATDAERLTALGQARVLRREIEDDLNRGPRRGFEVHARLAPLLVNGAKLIAVALRNEGDANGVEYVVLVKRDERHQPFVVAAVYVHDDTGRTQTGWDTGSYFDDERTARVEFARRAKLTA